MQPAKDLSHLLSEEALRRLPARIKYSYIDLQGRSDVVKLGSGLPSDRFFPIDNVAFDSPMPPFAAGVDAAFQDNGVQTLVTPKVSSDDGVIPLTAALQYGQSRGNVALVDWCRVHFETVHTPAFSDWDLMLTAGNNCTWDTVLRTFASDKGDSVLMEAYTFPGSTSSVEGVGAHMVPVPMDLQGIVPEKLEEMLDQWPADRKKPKLIYTIPTGQNPMGSTLSVERRRCIYAICQKHDLLIVEDEPYYFLQMAPYKQGKVEMPESSPTPNHKDFLSSLVPSFLSFDTDGRVIHLYSFSKVIAPGTRMGFVVAQKAFIHRFSMTAEGSYQTPSGLSQAVVYSMLHRWGQHGYLDWLLGLRKAYTRRRDILCEALFRTLPFEVAEFEPPVAGMFATVRFDATKHKDYKPGNTSELENQVYYRLLDAGVQLLPGNWFVCGERQDKTGLYFRATFAAASEQDLVRGVERFAATMKQEYGL